MIAEPRPPKGDVRASNLLSGRALESDEIRQLFETCATDGTVKGIRDAEILAVLYGCGLRRGELVKLDVEDVDPDDGSILVEGKRRKQRSVYLTESALLHIRGWLEIRGDVPGPLFTAVRQSGEIPTRRLGGESTTYILRRLQKGVGSRGSVLEGTGGETFESNSASRDATQGK